MTQHRWDSPAGPNQQQVHKPTRRMKAHTSPTIRTSEVGHDPEHKLSPPSVSPVLVLPARLGAQLPFVLTGGSGLSTRRLVPSSPQSSVLVDAGIFGTKAPSEDSG